MKKKLVYSFALLFLLFSAGAGFTMIYIQRVTSDLQSVIDLHRVEIIRQNLVINAQTVQSNLYTTGTVFGKELDVIVENVTVLDESAHGCISCHHSEAMTKRLQDVENTVEQYKDAISYLITTTANPERVERLKMVAVGVGDQLLSKTQEMAFIADKSLTSKTVNALKEINSSRNILIVTLALSLSCAILIAIGLTKQITKPMYELVNSARMIASGHLGYKTSYEDKTEFGELAKNFNLMSERLKEDREHIVQSTKLAAIGELASNVAHEINNPLTSIIGFTELIKDENDIDIIKNRLNIIETESMRARDIVRELLHFARKRPLQLTELDINQTLKDVLPLVESQAKMNNVELVKEYGHLPPTVGDPNQLKQVFINIINNAIAAMPDGGRLSFRTSVQGNAIIIRFQDTGHGIPPKIMERIFEPFFSTKKDKGTGLGLSISYRIIEEHGGRIDVASDEGKGSTFTVHLPVQSSL